MCQDNAALGTRQELGFRFSSSIMYFTSFFTFFFLCLFLSLYFFFTLFVFCRILSSLRMDCKYVLFSLDSLKNIYLFPKGINHHWRKQFIAPNSHSEKAALTANSIKWCFDWRMTLYSNILTPLTLSKGMAPVKVNYCWRQTNWKRHLLFFFFLFCLLRFSQWLQRKCELIICFDQRTAELILKT